MSRNATSISSSILEVKQEFSVPSMAIIPFHPFATPWFSNSAFESRDVYFRLFLDRDICAQHFSCEYVRKAYLQVCSSEQRDAAIQKEKQAGMCCLELPAREHTEATPAETMIFSQVSLTVPELESKYFQYVPSVKSKRLVTPLNIMLVTLPEQKLGVPSAKTSVQLGVSAEVVVFSIPPIAPAAAEEPRPGVSTSASAMLGRLLDSGVLSDLTLRVGGEELRAHRCVLAAASPVFRRMLEHTSSAESLQGLVDVQGVRPEVMAAALRFLYGQELGAALDVDTLCDLLVLAERYELLELKDHCDEQLAGDLKADPLQLLTLAVRNNAPRLREAAVKRIARSPDRESIINSDTIKEVIRSHPDVAQELILKL